MSQILIIGASSGIGLETLKTGLEAGHTIRAFARTAKKINIDHTNLEKMAGDALVADDIAEAVSGVDVVIQTLGIKMNFRMLTGPITLFSKATEILLPAMKAAGVKRLISVTGFGAGDSRSSIHPIQRPGFELIFGHAYRDKDIQERLIRESKLDWTIVRPGVLLKYRRAGRYKVLIDPHEWRNGVISRANVADFLIRQTGPDALLEKAPVLIS